MSSRKLQVFDLSKKLHLKKEFNLPNQVVEVKRQQDLIMVTTTNFSHLPPHHNKLWLIDPRSLKIISSVNTQGNWSKVPALHPSGKYILVSNWKSHDISVIDIRNRSRPSVIKLLSPPKGRQQLESPRAIEFTPNGRTALVTGFYSQNILEISYHPKRGFHFEHISSRLTPNQQYAGNPRDLITLNSQYAAFSNLGLNTVNLWSIPERKLLTSTKVGKQPNSLCLLDFNPLLAVSCRASQAVYLLNPQTFKILGRSSYTGQEPTGLCSTKNGFLVTAFNSHQLHLYHPLST